MKTKPKHLQIGIIGEEIARKYLVGRGFSIRDVNYRKPWGELDIVAEISGTVHFVEVKTVAREYREGKFIESIFKPVDNVTDHKVVRLRRIIETYLAQYHLEDSGWQFDVIGILYDEKNKKAKVEFMEDVVI
jgi:putative endonuclease